MVFRQIKHSNMANRHHFSNCIWGFIFSNQTIFRRTFANFLFSDVYCRVVELVIKKNDQKELPITYLKDKDRYKIAGLMLGFIILSGWFFSSFTDAHIPFWDSTATGISITAQLLLIRKKFETWFLWIIVDILSIGIYLYKEVYLTTFLYVVFLCMAIKGYFEWKKQIVKQKELSL